VRVGPTLKDADNCTGFENNQSWVELKEKLQRANRGRLQARAKKDDAAGATDPCLTSPEASYRGMENQLYRVEVHREGLALDNNGSNPATFKWSRDNGTIVAALKRKDGDRLIVTGLRDFSRWFAAGDWVEITHDALELDGLPGTLVKLAKAEGDALTIDRYTASGTVYEPDSKYFDRPVSNLKVRRWNHRELEDDVLQEGAIPIQENVLIELEDGVQILFEQGSPRAQYRTGDYWLIPARVSTGDVEWPKIDTNSSAGSQKKEPAPLPPHGVGHHYAPLAAVTLNGGQVTSVVDLRHKFPAQGVCSV
jgi:hypothetical protein